MKIGLVVEGQDDSNVYPVLVRKIRNDVEAVYVRQCRGVRTLKNKFVYFLKEFDSNPAHRIDIAIVIRDSDCNDAAVLENELERTLVRSHFVPTFPVRFHATKCKLESLLLADENAIMRVATKRGKIPPGPMGKLIVETLRDADTILVRRLADASLPADAKVFGEIAAESDRATIEARCPHFRRFADKVQNA